MNVDSATIAIDLATSDELDSIIVDAAVRRLRKWLDEARPGLCGRLNDLPLSLMWLVAERLYGEYGNQSETKANVRMLASGQPTAPWECSWTEAVRLRNPDEHGAKRPPLLLLVPPGTELLGSLDADTFNTIPCENVVRDILREQEAALPKALLSAAELLHRREIVRDTSEVQRARYLLTLARNHYAPEAVGLAFCILGLWPHRGWLASGDRMEYWLTRNRDVMMRLRNGTTSLLNRIYDLNLTSSDQARRLFEVLEAAPLLRDAAESIATDVKNADLDFGLWEFAQQPDTVVITVNTPDLPKHEDGYPVLLLKEQPHVSLTWTIAPPPTQAPALTHYLVELQSSTGGEVAYTSQTIVPGKMARKSHTIKDLTARIEAGDFIEGLYRARVTAWAGGTNITRQQANEDVASNVSGYFWIQNEGDEGGDSAPLPKERPVANFLEARREVQWALLKSGRDPWALPPAAWSWDGPVEGKKASQGVCVIRFGRQTFRIRLSNLLRRIEGMILAKPGSLGTLQASLAAVLAPKDVPLSNRSGIPALSDDDPFLLSRSRLFASIRGEDGQGTVETADLLALRSEIVEYAKEYGQLLQDGQRDVAADPQRWVERVGLAAIDTVRLTLPGLSDQTSVAIMLAPTHPLRLLWLLQLALVADSWLKEANLRGSVNELTADLRQALQGGFTPLNLPPVLFDHRRVSYLQAGMASPGWDIYLPADVADKASALSRLSSVLGSGGRVASSLAPSVDLCDRVLRYLRQHPYVEQLQINVFNPGDGATIADLLSQIDRVYSDMRYDIRLFSHDSVRDDLGAALDRLVNPEITIGESAEKYSQGGIYPLHPNLSYSKNRFADFLTAPQEYQAHLSILVDVFHPRVDVAMPFAETAASSLYGLVQEESVRRHGEKGAFAWERQVIVGPAREIAAGAQEATLLGTVLEATQHFTAALGAGPSTNLHLAPTVRLDLSVQGQNLLYEVHRVSDWVLTVDRHLGIDYFDSAARPGGPISPGILLDFAPEFPSTDQAVLMLTTRVDQEIDHLVSPALQRLGLDGPERAERIVEWLRSLSGRLAMRLLTAPLAAQGVIGMALARAFLSRIELLSDTVVIPVDAHIGLLQKGLSPDTAMHRTDLILARRMGATRQIEFTLIEVKCTASDLTAAEFQALRDEIEKQIAQTQTALTTLFDPANQVQDRIDRPLRNLVLRRLLHFYIGRGRRYGLLTEDAEREFLTLISDLDAGYAVSFRQLGVVFEVVRDDDGDELGGELPIYRVGRRTCEKLLSGDHDTEPPPPSWDRLRTTIRGSALWTRPASEIRQEQAPAKAEDESSQADPPPGRETSHQDTPQLDTNDSDPGSDTGDPDRGTSPTAQAFGPPTYGYMVGSSVPTPQWGLLGKRGEDSVALDLNGCNTLSIFGVQGGGKSYTMGAILEMVVRPLLGLNVLPKPMAAVIFHYNESQDYAPEYVSMAYPNSVASEVTRLRNEYHSDPNGIGDILVLVPEDKVILRRQEFPGVTVEPIGFHPAELTIQDWRFLMGAVGNDSLYIKELNLVMRALRDKITVVGLRQGIDDSLMSEAQRRLAHLRLRFAEQFVHDGPYLRDKLYPGRLVIVDLRDELIETDEALGLFVVMLRVFAGATHKGHPFNKWIAFDEAHKYIRNTDLVDSVVAVIRQMRHQGTSVLIASQDPLSLPLRIIELSSMVFLHRMDSPGWLKHIQKAVTALGDLTPPALSNLRPGEAYLWSRAATDAMFTRRAVKLQGRPRATQHGGTTRSAMTE